jgi:glycosyltransferase involved in cell wall biosynthesis
MSGRGSTAVKRNIGCETARGDIFMQWDDDDWYGPARVSRQVAPLVEGRADITAFDMRWFAQVEVGECWTVSPALHRRMFLCDVHCGTLAFTRGVWTAGVRYADGDFFEDVAFLGAVLDRGGRLLRVANDELFVYVRHQANTWRFPVGRHLDPRGWGRTTAPSAFSPALMARYQCAAREVALPATW